MEQLLESVFTVLCCVLFTSLDKEETVALVDGIHPMVLVRESESYEGLRGKVV